MAIAQAREYGGAGLTVDGCVLVQEAVGVGGPGEGAELERELVGVDVRGDLTELRGLRDWLHLQVQPVSEGNGDRVTDPSGAGVELSGNGEEETPAREGPAGRRHGRHGSHRRDTTTPHRSRWAYTDHSSGWIRDGVISTASSKRHRHREWSPADMVDGADDRSSV
jgi:hypothetical protein